MRANGPQLACPPSYSLGSHLGSALKEKFAVRATRLHESTGAGCADAPVVVLAAFVLRCQNVWRKFAESRSAALETAADPVEQIRGYVHLVLVEQLQLQSQQGWGSQRPSEGLQSNSI